MKHKASLWISIFALIISLSSLLFALQIIKTSHTKNLHESILHVAAQQPEKLMEAIKLGMEKKEQEKRKAALSKLLNKKDSIFNSTTPYFIGNPKGSVIFIEFLDYNCGFCKRAHEIAKEVIKNHPEVKILLKEFPILGESSELSAKVALASAKQGKYKEVHKALILNQRPLRTIQDVKTFAHSLELNVDQLLADMNDPSLEKILQENVELALSLGIQGTPGFISKNNVFPGMISKDQFAKLVREELRKHKIEKSQKN